MTKIITGAQGANQASVPDAQADHGGGGLDVAAGLEQRARDARVDLPMVRQGGAQSAQLTLGEVELHACARPACAADTGST